MEGRRPAALTALAIIAIVLGALISLGAFWQIITLAFQGPLQQANMMMMDQPGVPQEMLDRQREMMEASFCTSFFIPCPPAPGSRYPDAFSTHLE